MVNTPNAIILERDAIISEQFCGQRVDAALAQVFPEFSRSQLTQWLKQGAITLDGRPRKPKDKILGQEHACLHAVIPSISADGCQPEDIPLDIIYEDDVLLIINKPAGLVVHPGAGNAAHTLVNALLFHEPALHHLPRAGIVHRLDKDTTGLLIVAKTLESHTALIRQMQERLIQRHYLTLVYGHLISGATIDTGYGRHPTHRLKKAVCPQGRQAITHYRLYQQYKYVTLLDVALMTGRTHQIRVHMAHINHPVVGDPLYGGRTRFPSGADASIRDKLHQFKRQALHAYSLSLTHPVTGEVVACTAPLPDDFQCLLNALEPYALLAR